MSSVLYVTKHSLPQIVTHCGLAYSEPEQLVWLFALLFHYKSVYLMMVWRSFICYNFYSTKDSNIPEILLYKAKKCKTNRGKKMIKFLRK